MLGIPLTLPQTEQGPRLRRRDAGGGGLRAYPSVHACAEAFVHAKSTTRPDAALVEKYNVRYAVAQAVPGTESIPLRKWRHCNEDFFL